MSASDDVVRSVIAQQAGEWLISNQAGDLSDADSAAFLAWLKASPIHIEEYLGVMRVAHRVRDAVREPQMPLETFLAQARTEDENIVAFDTPPATDDRAVLRGSSPRVWRFAAAAAALAVLAVGALRWVPVGDLMGLPPTYQTGHGESGERQLPDGSVLRLDTDSSVTIRYTDAERVVELNRGQAFFQVVHEHRRFRVVAGEAGVVAVGTRFNVFRKTDATMITVAEGQVAVFTGEPAWIRNAAAPPERVARIGAGYQVRVDAGAMPAQAVSVDLDQTLGWLRHNIVFKHRPLNEVAAEFNRYGRIPLEIEDLTLRTLPVSGRFDATDTDSFVLFLATLPGVTVEKTPTRIRVLRTATAI